MNAIIYSVQVSHKDDDYIIRNDNIEHSLEKAKEIKTFLEKEKFRKTDVVRIIKITYEEIK